MQRSRSCKFGGDGLPEARRRVRGSGGGGAKADAAQAAQATRGAAKEAYLFGYPLLLMEFQGAACIGRMDAAGGSADRQVAMRPSRQCRTWRPFGVESGPAMFS